MAPTLTPNYAASGSVGAETARAEAAEALLAPLASPALTGNPTVPTQAPLTNNTRAASTAYTDAAVMVLSGNTRFKAIRNITLPVPSGGDDAPILNAIFASAQKGDAYEWNGTYVADSIPIILPEWTRHYSDGPQGVAGAVAGSNASANGLPAVVVSAGFWNNHQVTDNPIEISRLTFACSTGNAQSGVRGFIGFNWSSIFEDVWTSNLLNADAFVLSSVNKNGLAGMVTTTGNLTASATTLGGLGTTPADGTYLIWSPNGGLTSQTTVTFVSGVGTLSQNATATVTGTTLVFVPSGGYVNSGTMVNNVIRGGRHQYTVNGDGVRTLDPAQVITDGVLRDVIVAGGNEINNAIRIDDCAGWTLDNNHPYGYLYSAVLGYNCYGTTIRTTDLDGWGELGNAVLPSSVTLPQATIAVSSTTGWPSSGTAIVNGQTVTYTGTTKQSLTGCTGGTGTQAQGSYIVCQSITATVRGMDLTVAGTVPLKLIDNFSRHDVALVPGVSYETLRIQAAAASTAAQVNIIENTMRATSSSEYGIVIDDFGSGNSAAFVNITSNRGNSALANQIYMRGSASVLQANEANSWQYASVAPTSGIWPLGTKVYNTAFTEYSLNFVTSAHHWILMSTAQYINCNGVTGQPTQITVGTLTGVAAAVGAWVTGAGIPAGTTITNIAGSTWTLSNNVTVSTSANETVLVNVWAPQYPNTIVGVSANQVFRIGGNGAAWGTIFGTGVDVGAAITAYKLSLNQASKSSSYVMQPTDSLILASGASTTITLPDATLTFSSGVRPTVKSAFGYIVKNIGTANVTVNTTSSQTIDNSTQIVLTPMQTAQFVSDGSNWWIF